jgi:hypothetical protein
MKGNKSQTLDKPLVISMDTLSNLVRQLEEKGGELRFELKCSDGAELYPIDLEELSVFPNPERSQITQLTIRSSYSREPRLSVSFENHSIHSVTYTVSGDSDYISSVSKVMIEHIEAMVGDRPYWLSRSFFAKEILGSLLGPVFGGLAFFGALSLIWRAYHPNSGTPSIATSLVFLVFGSALAALSSQLSRLMQHFFPNAIFCIGAGSVRYERMRTLRSKLGVGAIVSLGVGILGRVIWLAATGK